MVEFHAQELSASKSWRKFRRLRYLVGWKLLNSAITLAGLHLFQQP
jgi:hypothetical protein